MSVRIPLLLEKLLAKAAAATMSMMMYWITVTVLPAQNEPGASSVNVRLHWSMLTAYFWNGNIAE